MVDLPINLIRNQRGWTLGTGVRVLILATSATILAVTAVAVAYLTVTIELVMPTRSGMACYHAVPTCPPFSSAPIRVLEPNWVTGIGISIVVAALAVGIACFAFAKLARHREPSGGGVGQRPDS